MATDRERLDDLLARHPMRDWRLPALLVMLLLTAALVWAALARFNEVATAMGRVIPRDQVKTVQHLEGGLIEAVHVRDGDAVSVGDSLVVLDLTSIVAEVEALQVQIDGLELKRARLLAETNGEPAQYPAAVAARRPVLLAAEQRNFDQRAAQIASTLKVVDEQVKQRQLEVEELEALLAGLRKSLPLAEESLRMSASLLDDDLTPRMEHIELQREVEGLRSAVEQAASSFSRGRAALAEAQERRREAQLEFQRLASEELAETEVSIASRREVLLAIEDQQRRTVVTAPINGVVQNLRYHTVGGVIAPGEPIVDIVPADDKLLIEARVDPRDIGHVKAGMRATAKISAYDFVRYGSLDGEVVHVAADATTSQDGTHYFRIEVETSETSLGGGDLLPIIPGMVATVDIHTGSKRVLEYLVGPVIKMRHEAFRER